jgi:hypothetical protein
MGKLENTKNDRCSKEFFEFHIKGSNKKVNIIELVDGGRSLQTPEEIQEYVQRYYADLYSNDDTVDNNTAAREQCLLSVQRVIAND